VRKETTSARLWKKRERLRHSVSSVWANDTRTGVAKMTLYNHFASKEDLIVAALAFKQARLALLRELCRKMGVKDADTLAWQIAMQMEGAIVVAFMHARPDAAQDAKAAALALIAAARRG